MAARWRNSLSADMDATELAEMEKAAAKEVRRAKALAFARAGYSALEAAPSPGTGVSLAAAPIAATGASKAAPSRDTCNTPLMHQPTTTWNSDGAGPGPPKSSGPPYTPEVQPNRDRESTPGRRAEEPPRAMKCRPPLGMAHYADSTTQYKDVKRAQWATEEDTRREAARTTAVTERRAKSPVLSPDLDAMLLTSGAARKVHGLPPHTLETFLQDMHRHALYPQAAHQNETPQEPTEHDL